VKQAFRSDVLVFAMVGALLAAGFGLKIWRYGHQETVGGPSEIQALQSIADATGWRMSENLIADHGDGEPFPIFMLDSDRCEAELYVAPLASIPDTTHLVRQRFGDDMAFLQRGVWRDEIAMEWALTVFARRALQHSDVTPGALADIPLLAVTPDPRQLSDGCDLASLPTLGTATHSN